MGNYNKPLSFGAPSVNTGWGWVDYNDTATAGSPIALTVAGTYYDLTNDGLGAQSIDSYIPGGHGEIWNAATDRFDWSSLKLGDAVDLRIDIEVTTSGPTRDIKTKLDMAIGGSFPYSLPIDHRSFKTAGTYQFVINTTVTMAFADTLDNPAKVSVSSDNTGDTVVVNGWQARTLIR